MDPLDTKGAVEKVTLTEEVTRPLVRTVAVFTSFFALIAAFAGIMSGRCTVRGTLAKNDAILVQSFITDEWTYYQSRNVRMEIAETIGLLNPSAKTQKAIADKTEKMKKDKEESFQRAKVQEKQRDAFNQKSTQYLDVSKSFASALVLLQVALVLVPLTLLTQTGVLLRVGIPLGLVGVGYMVVAYIQYFKVL